MIPTPGNMKPGAYQNNYENSMKFGGGNGPVGNKNSGNQPVNKGGLANSLMNNDKFEVLSQDENEPIQPPPSQQILHQQPQQSHQQPPSSSHIQQGPPHQLQQQNSFEKKNYQNNNSQPPSMPPRQGGNMPINNPNSGQNRGPYEKAYPNMQGGGDPTLYGPPPHGMGYMGFPPQGPAFPPQGGVYSHQPMGVGGYNNKMSMGGQGNV